MAKPIVMTIDDEPHVLNAIARDLQAHYQGDYRIIKAKSGEEALEAVHEFKRRNDSIALFLADQRMPSMSGVEFLEEAIKHYPGAKRVLLTAYADTDAAITSINTIGLDYYLMKPWDPPEERLYPVLDDLLSDWLASVPAPFDGIRRQLRTLHPKAAAYLTVEGFVDVEALGTTEREFNEAIKRFEEEPQVVAVESRWREVGDILHHELFRRDNQHLTAAELSDENRSAIREMVIDAMTETIHAD